MRLVRLDLVPLPSVASIADALRPDATMLRDGIPNSVHRLHHHVGEPEDRFAAAERVLEGSFKFHRVAAMPLEPRAAKAWRDGTTGKLHVTATTQIPGVARDSVS